MVDPLDLAGTNKQDPNGRPTARSYKQRLVVNVVWHPDFKRERGSEGGQRLAEHLYSLLTHEYDEPIARGIGIPVYFRSCLANGKLVPETIRVDDAHHTVVVVLVDDSMVRAPGWGQYVGEIWEEASRSQGRHRIVPVMVTHNAFNLDSRLNRSNFVRLEEFEGEEQYARLAIGVIHELCRTLMGEPSIAYGSGSRVLEDRVTVFLSHTKAGNDEDVVRRTRKLLRKNARSGGDEDVVAGVISVFRSRLDAEPRKLKLKSFGVTAKPGRKHELISGLRELFEDYSKLDVGKIVAEGIRDYIRSELQLSTFFDSQEIPFGAEFASIIGEYIERSALLIVQTDAYSTRAWCLREVLTAKRLRRPVLVVNAVRIGERRGFPYLGNVPTIRFAGLLRPNYAAIVCQMLLEVLRVLHFKKHFEDLRDLFEIPANIHCLTQSPELLTLVELRRAGENSKTFVYPDPPLGEDELELLQGFDDDLTVTTPVFLLATEAQSSNRSAPETTMTLGPTPILNGKSIGLSIGDSPDLASRGLSRAHLSDAMIGFARYLLASGATLVYGSNLRPGSFTETLLDLIQLQSAEFAGRRPVSRLKSFFPSFRSVNLTKEDEARYKNVCNFEIVPSPPDVKADRSSLQKGKTLEYDYLHARCLTALRERTNAESDARVFLGGKTLGYSGKYPGLLEEALLALRDGIPIYLIGGFGGCAWLLVQALLGGVPQELSSSGELKYTIEASASGVPEELTNAYQLRHQRRYGELARLFETMEGPGGKPDPIDYEFATTTLRAAGIAGLRNGLLEEENLRLFVTPHIDEMIFLVLRGLSRSLCRSPREGNVARLSS